MSPKVMGINVASAPNFHSGIAYLKLFSGNVIQANSKVTLTYVQKKTKQKKKTRQTFYNITRVQFHSLYPHCQ